MKTLKHALLATNARPAHLCRTWRGLLWGLVLLCALFWLPKAFAQESGEGSATPTATPAALSPFSGGAGVVSGRVVNGTTGTAPPEGMEVRLRAFDMVDAAFIDAITTTTASDGAFRFEGIDPSAPVQMEPLVVYQGVLYYGDMESAIVLSPEQPQFDVTVTVYEPTQDDSAIRIERLHVVFEFAMGQVQVAEIYVLSNDGQQPYVGTVEGGTLRLSVPDDALTFQPGGDPARYLALADGVADTVPIPPGEGTAESVLIYDLVYDDHLELSRPLPYDVNQVIVLLPSVGVEVSGEGLEPGEPFTMQDIEMQVYLVNDLLAGERLTLSLSGAPQALVTSTDSRMSQPDEADEIRNTITGLVILVVALVLAYLYWQGYLNLRRDPQPALVQAIADLDDDFEAGRLKQEPYQARRTQLKQELLTLMEKQSPISNIQSPP